MGGQETRLKKWAGVRSGRPGGLGKPWVNPVNRAREAGERHAWISPLETLLWRQPGGQCNSGQGWQWDAEVGHQGKPTTGEVPEQRLCSLPVLCAHPIAAQPDLLCALQEAQSLVYQLT